ncbi:hypothetical protein BY996DRAFT_2420921 [Phakopsora pachyrhizi]|nr:hypothetical protein BY996DRAFT_2420921 [Phakopsora pachyrhizi]
MRMPLIDRSSTAPVLPYRSKKNFCSREKPGFLRRLSDSFSNCVKEGNKLHNSESFPLLPAVQHSKQTHPELMSSFFGRRSASIVGEPEKNESDEERRGSVYRAVRDFSSGENHDQKATACWKDYVFSPSRLICKNAEHLPQSNRPKRKSRDINCKNFFFPKKKLDFDNHTNGLLLKKNSFFFAAVRFFNGKQTKSNLKIKRSFRKI